MLKKLLLTLLILITNLLALDFTNNNFNKWVYENSRTTQNIGLSYDEGTLGAQYQVNTNFALMDVGRTNWYSIFMVNDYRAEFYEAYDVLDNKGFNGFQILPFAGFGIDVVTADFSFIIGTKARYNINEKWGFEIGTKYFLIKPTSYTTEQGTDENGYPVTKTVIANNDKNPDEKLYYTITFTYNF